MHSNGLLTENLYVYLYIVGSKFRWMSNLKSTTPLENFTSQILRKDYTMVQGLALAPNQCEALTQKMRFVFTDLFIVYVALTGTDEYYYTRGGWLAKN